MGGAPELDSCRSIPCLRLRCALRRVKTACDFDLSAWLSEELMALCKLMPRSEAGAVRVQQRHHYARPLNLDVSR